MSSPCSAFGLQRDLQHRRGQAGPPALQHPRSDAAGGSVSSAADRRCRGQQGYHRPLTTAGQTRHRLCNRNRHNQSCSLSVHCCFKGFSNEISQLLKSVLGFSYIHFLNKIVSDFISFFLLHTRKYSTIILYCFTFFHLKALSSFLPLPPTLPLHLKNKPINV